jgi:hypothetical protein
MPFPIHLLERAYQLINANQFQNAELVLDAVVRVDPQNVEAWKTYLLIHQSQNDLDWLKERIIKTKELSEVDKTKLINYYLYLTKEQNGTEQVIFQTDIFSPFLQEKIEETTSTEETAIQFELIDVFDYPTKIVQKETRTRPRRRAIYNPFTFDIASGILKAMSHDPLGKKITDYIHQMIKLANDLVKNPKETYARLSKSPHFEKYIGIALLTLFILGVRLVISSQFFGYVFLGMFVIGGRWWLLNFGTHRTPALSNQVRVYLHENKTNLPVIKEVGIDQEQKSNEENIEYNIDCRIP